MYDRMMNETVNTTTATFLQPEKTSFFTIRLTLLVTYTILTLLANSSLLYILWTLKNSKTIKNDGFSCYMINLSILNLIALVVSKCLIGEKTVDLKNSQPNF